MIEIKIFSMGKVIEKADKVEESFVKIFRYMGIPKEDIRDNVSFSNDLHFEDFQFTCLAFYIGAYFNVNIKEDEFTALDTIGSTMNFVRNKLTKN